MTAVLVFVLRILLLVLAYLFVGWIGFTIYKDLRSQLHTREALSASPITLHVLTENNPIEKQFSKPEIILGRDPDCDLTISDGTISLRHCQISYHHKQWWVSDLNSTNGSFLNNNLITSAIIITDGDVLQLGNVPIDIRFNQ